MKIYKLKVKTKNQIYNIIIGTNILKKILKILKDNKINFDKCLLVIDNNVPKKILEKIKFSLRNKKKYTYIFNSSEINKNQKKVNEILTLLLKNNFHRNDYLISIGGGITGDVASFAASIYKRGINFINIPTTLLAQVDSSIGGKTGINSNYGKNLIGTFYQPKLVLSDTHFLKSLKKREIICGYAEILKHSLIKNNKLFNFLENNAHQIIKLKKPFVEKAIYESCLIKKKIVEKDEREKKLRKILNFGHTFGHAYEATKNYSKKLNHGEAVLLGMANATKFSYKKNYINKQDYERIIKHYNKLKLPLKISKFFSRKDLDKIITFMQKDKKNNNNKINLILLKKIGKTLHNLTFSRNQIYKFLKKELIN